MRWYPLVAVLLLGYLAAVSIVQDVEFVRRLGNIAVLMTVAGFMASGRIDIASGLKGIGVALLINLGLFYAGIAPDTYGGVLTGYTGDKNAAGLIYGLGALLVSITTRRVGLRALILVAGFGALVLTDSRTSMAAYACAAAWIVLAPRLGTFFRALLFIGSIAAFLWADENLADSGEYATVRAGSDALRARIDEAANQKVEGLPWYGGGLGEATVEVNNGFWFFHNAYDGLRAEGGWIALVVVVTLFVVVGFGFYNRNGHSYAVTAVGAATIFLLLAATRLGEVFFAPIGFILLGVGLALIVEYDPFVRDPRLHLNRGQGG